MSDAARSPIPPVQVPGAHLGLRWRAPRSADLAPLLALTRRAGSADRAAHVVTARELEAAALGEQAVALVGVDGSDEPRAAAWVVRSGSDHLTLGMVDPRWRGQGIGRALLTWQLDVTRARLAGSPGTLHTLIDEGNLARRRLHAAAGFAPQERSVLLTRDLAPRTRPATPEETPAAVATDATGAQIAALLSAGAPTAPCLMTGLLGAGGAEAVDPTTTLVLRGPDGTIRAALPGFAPVAPLGARPDADGAGLLVESHLLPADDADDVARLLRGAAALLAARGVTRHAVHVPAATPWRGVLEAAGYTVGAVRTRFSVAL